jgi:hypothetical protein
VLVVTLPRQPEYDDHRQEYGRDDHADLNSVHDYFPAPSGVELLTACGKSKSASSCEEAVSTGGQSSFTSNEKRGRVTGLPPEHVKNVSPSVRLHATLKL